MKPQLKNINQKFKEILKQKKLRNTKQRNQILETFLSTNGHISVDELYNILKKTNPKIGYATVYRTLKLLKELKIAEGIKVDNQKILYEHKYHQQHHDHLICVKCNKFIEIISDEIEKLQEKITSKYNFENLDHKLIIYGICKDCKKL